jgi:CRP-like cAMP-binding protein
MSKFLQFKQWLKEVSYLTKDDCDLFEVFLQVKTIEKNELLLSPGQVCKEIGFVNNGLFRIYYIINGKEVNTHFVFENEFVVDYFSFIEQLPGKYYIQALEQSEIVTFNLAALQNGYTKSHNWERFGRNMAEYSYKLLTKRMESFLFTEGRQRYLDLLQAEPRIFNRLPIYHIASYLGLERESLSRLRREVAKRD